MIKGLEGVIAAQTAISQIDGINGRLFYRGIDIDELAEHSTFEETTALLWYGRLPTAHQLESFKQKFINNRQIPYEILSLMMAMPKKTPTMEVLRTAISALSPYDPEDLDNSLEANVHKSLRLTASMPTVIAAWERIRNNQWPILPRTDLSHAANFLYMMNGEEPDPKAAAVLDKCLILHADHGLNASTFAARVTASAMSDLHSAIVSAIGTLKGPLHGGANEQVMRMLLEIGNPERAEQIVRGMMDGKKKIMGFGHRVYKNYDPRAKIIKQVAYEVFEVTGKNPLLDVALKLEEVALTDEYFTSRRLYPNVDFYSGLIYQAMGFPISMFTVLFAIPRTAGWLAHWQELLADKEQKISRPRQWYTGADARDYTPLAAR